MSYKLRPFDRYVSRGFGLPMWTIIGEIRDGAFVVCLSVGSVALRTTELGSDERGPFAIVEAANYELPHGFYVGMSQEEDGTPRMRVACDGTARSRAERQTALSGIDPNSVNLLIPPDQVHDIYFHDGVPEQHHGFGRDDEPLN